MERRSNACIIGNGPSRLIFDLHEINAIMYTYGCNALYRDFMPDYLISHDMGIADEIVAKKVHYQTHFYTQHGTKMNHRANIGEPINFVIHDQYMGDSGTGALRIALSHNYDNIYMIGFDYCDSNNMIYNVYTGTDHYNNEPLDYAQNFVLHQWENRLQHWVDSYIDTTICHVRGSDYTPKITGHNFYTITTERFKEIINEL